MDGENMVGYVYLLHFDSPISPRHTAQHYLGWTYCLPARIQKHWHGAGARLTAVAKERGIGFKVVRVWRGGRRLERRLKARHDAPRLCPVCNQRVQLGLFELTPAEITAELIPF